MYLPSYNFVIYRIQINNTFYNIYKIYVGNYANSKYIIVFGLIAMYY